MESCTQNRYNAGNTKTIQVKVEDVDITTQFLDENVCHIKAEVEVKIENDDLCDASQKIDKNKGVNYRKYDSKSNIHFHKNNDKKNINRSWLKSFMKNLFESNNIYSKDMYLDQDICVAKKIEENTTQAAEGCEIDSVKIEHVDIPEIRIIDDKINDIKPYTILQNDCIREQNYEEDPLKEEETDQKEVQEHSDISVKSEDIEFHNIKEEMHEDYALITEIKLNFTKFNCDLCGHGSNKKWILDQHMSSAHFMPKQHKCDQCDYTAKQKYKVTRHVEIVHLNVKRYKCKLCNYSANHQFSLKYHMNSLHLSAKCEFCDHVAVGRKNLKEHVKSAHKDVKRYKCKFCDYAVNSMKCFERHLTTVHEKSD